MIVFFFPSTGHQVSGNEAKICRPLRKIKSYKEVSCRI